MSSPCTQTPNKSIKKKFAEANGTAVPVPVPARDQQWSRRGRSVSFDHACLIVLCADDLNLSYGLFDFPTRHCSY